MNSIIVTPPLIFYIEHFSERILIAWRSWWVLLMFNFSLNCQFMSGSTFSLLFNVCIPNFRSCSWKRPPMVKARVSVSGLVLCHSDRQHGANPQNSSKHRGVSVFSDDLLCQIFLQVMIMKFYQILLADSSLGAM